MKFSSTLKIAIFHTVYTSQSSDSIKHRHMRLISIEFAWEIYMPHFIRIGEMSNKSLVDFIWNDITTKPCQPQWATTTGNHLFHDADITIMGQVFLISQVFGISLIVPFGILTNLNLLYFLRYIQLPILLKFYRNLK